MKSASWTELLCAAFLVALAALFPLGANGYWLSIGVTAMMYVALATSWALFSGPTHYISLATGAFFGVGGYLVGSGMSDYAQPFWIMAAISPVVGAILAALIGLATLRLSGVYFVIFTLGLAEMIRNGVSWVQNNFLGSRGLYVLTDLRDQHIFWMLLAVAAAVYLLGWWVTRSRIGFALRIIGGDETVARHVGIQHCNGQGHTLHNHRFLCGPRRRPDRAEVELHRAEPGILPPAELPCRHHGAPGRIRQALGAAGWRDSLHDHLGVGRGPVPEPVDALPRRLLPADRLRPAQRCRWPDRRAARADQGADLRQSGAVLSVKGVTKRFGGLVAVSNMSFDVAEHQMVGVIGPNGSGKTTVLNMISGALKPTEGRISMRGRNISDLPAQRIAREGVGRTFQLVRLLPGLTVLENVIAGAVYGYRRRWGREAEDFAHGVLDRVGMDAMSHAPISSLTYIDQKRVELARHARRGTAGAAA